MGAYFELAKNKTPEFTSIEYISKQHFESNKLNIVKRGVPFVVTNYVQNLNPNVLLKTIVEYFGDTTLSVRTHTSVESYAKKRLYEQITVLDYLDLIKKSNEKEIPYAANNVIDKRLLELLGLKYPLPEMENKMDTPKLWIGGKGTSTPLHRDSSDNFVYHLFGQKKWTIFSIKDDQSLYFEQNDYGTKANPFSEFSVSPIDINNVDKLNYPLYPQAKMFEYTSSEGAALYLPYGWGHCVENLTTSIMINFWFKLENYIPLILKQD